MSMNNLQKTILEIIKYVDEFCKQNDIRYYLMGGSALGAIRHGGFIPWDDDLDIFMDSDNYFRFIDCCKKKLDTKRFYFQQEDSDEQAHFFCKIRMNGTTYIEHANEHCKNMHQGIFVDIMCLNHAARSRLGKKLQYYAAGLLKAKAITKYSYETDSKVKKLQLCIAKFVVVGPIKKFLLYMVRRNNGKKTDMLCHLFGRAKFDKSFYPYEDFGIQRYVPFETIMLPVPANVEDYLTIRYGSDYMQMPSEETKKMYESHAVFWDVEKDYTEYVGAHSNGKV